MHPEALKNWVCQDEADRGERSEQLSAVERDGLKRLRAGNAELRRGNDILRRRARSGHGQGHRLPAHPRGADEVCSTCPPA